MKFVIFNYSSATVMQPIYLKQEIEKIEGCSCTIVNDVKDVYYAYDRLKPDYCIVNAIMDLSYLLHYNQNTTKKVNHIVNMEYFKNEHLDGFKEFLKEQTDLNCVLLFGPNWSYSKFDFGIPYIQVPNCANAAIPLSKKIFEIDRAVIVKDKSEIKNYDGTNHFIAIANENRGVDSSINSLSAARIFCNYKEIVFRNMSKDLIPESFFNAIHFSESPVYFDNDDSKESQDVQNVLEKMLGVKTSFDYNNRGVYDTEALRLVVTKKHTPHNRLKHILSNIKETHVLVERMNKNA